MLFVRVVPSIGPLLQLLLCLAVVVVDTAPTQQRQQHVPKCSYKVPTVDEVVLGVPLESPSGEHHRRRRAIYRNLRIKPHYDNSIRRLSPDSQRFIYHHLLPKAVRFWERALMVEREDTPILLDRKCNSSQYIVHRDPVLGGTRSCSGPCRQYTKCGEVVVPDEHLHQCRYCSSRHPISCTVSGAPDGQGVRDVDFLLYVSAVASDRCDGPDTVAYAAHCQQEAELDRPIAGHVNLCPMSVSTEPHDQEVLISTVKHEILHALGFSAGLYAFYRNPVTKQPLTPRNSLGRPLHLDHKRGYYKWSTQTVRTVERSDWYALSGKMRHNVDMVVTPNVVRHVRKHFNCATLEGAELENQGGDGTRMTHWEKRLFENEAMTGTHTQNPVYSAITLALMEDTGWYRANYSVAEHLHWGHNLGCDFAQKSCAEWITSRKLSDNNEGAVEHQNVRNSSKKPTSPFCDDVKQRDAATYTTCTDTRDALALCNLQEYTKPLPLPFQNMLSLPGVTTDRLAFYGGSVELADFCPYNQEFEWRNSSSSNNKPKPADTPGASKTNPIHGVDKKWHRRDSRCEFETNTPEGIDNGALEEYGGHARCFHHASRWTQKKCGYTRRFLYYGAGCYQYNCTDGRIVVSLLNNTATYVCSYAYQIINVRRIHQGWLHEGSIVCPACTELCEDTGRLAPNFKCAADRRPDIDPSDLVLPVPCRSAHLQSTTFNIVFCVSMLWALLTSYCS